MLSNHAHNFMLYNMRNLAFHIVLFLTVVVFVILYLYSERIYQEGATGSSQEANMNPASADSPLTSVEIIHLKINLTNGAYYVIMDALENQASLYSPGMNLAFCSSSGIIAKSCQLTGEAIPACLQAVENKLPQIVSELLTDIPANSLLEDDYVKYQKAFFAGFKANYLKALQKEYPSTSRILTTDLCLFFQNVFQEVASDDSLGGIAGYYPTDSFLSVLGSIVRGVDDSSLATVGDVKDYVSVVKDTIQKQFVDVWFPTFFPYPRTNDGKTDMYRSYATRLNNTVGEAVDNLFATVNMSDYLSSTLVQSIALGKPVQGVVQPGDPGTIFQFPLSTSYGSDPKKYCKTGRFHSVYDPEAQRGDLVHFICD